ncbi:hypothetical protein ABG067_009283, partial [Albugo candida]
MDVVEHDYDYNQDYEDNETDINDNDDIMDSNKDDDMDEFDDDYDMFGESDEEIVEQSKPLMTVSDYIYFTLPSKGIDSSILESLSLKGNILENGSTKQL